MFRFLEITKVTVKHTSGADDNQNNGYSPVAEQKDKSREAM